MSKYALIDTASGFVKQWQDDSLFGYADPVAGEQRIQLPDGFQFPTVPTWSMGGNFSSTDPASLPAAVLAKAKSDQSAAITAACANAIVAGFTSTALGSPHTYPSKLTDQQNLMASVLDALLNAAIDGWTTPFWCATADATGALTWSWVAHTAAQIRQVGQDGKASVLAAQTKAAMLQPQIAAATTVDAVKAVAW